jgi:hypothetical protein
MSRSGGEACCGHRGSRRILTTYLFSFGLVPVQDWIEKARRSRDLRAGSVWLWHVMAKVLSHLRDGQGAEILLPREPSDDPDGSFSAIARASFAQALALPYGIPNRASGYLEAATDEQVREAFGGLQLEVVQAAWDALKREHLNAESAVAGGLWRKLWQLPSFRSVWEAGDDSPVTLIWAAAKAEPARSSRRENLAAAERLYAAAKRTRPVLPWRFGSSAGKCNQCGQREAVGPAEPFADWLDWQEEMARDPAAAAGRRLDPGERLCHVCLVRRMAGYATRPEFPSTGLIAMAPWRARARRDRVLSRLLADLDARRDLARPCLVAESHCDRRRMAASDGRTVPGDQVTAIAEGKGERASVAARSCTSARAPSSASAMLVGQVLQ